MMLRDVAQAELDAVETVEVVWRLSSPNTATGGRYLPSKETVTPALNSLLGTVTCCLLHGFALWASPRGHLTNASTPAPAPAPAPLTGPQR